MRVRAAHLTSSSHSFRRICERWALWQLICRRIISSRPLLDELASRCVLSGGQIATCASWGAAWMPRDAALDAALLEAACRR